MRKSVVLLIGVLAVSIVLGMMLVQSLFVVQRIASLSDVAGRVLVRVDPQQPFRPLAETERIFAGTTLKTGPEATVTLNWVDGSRVRLGPETQLTVRECSLNTSTRERTSLFDLDAGEIWVRVLPDINGESEFQIQTPTATAGVRGTVFRIAVAPGGMTEVDVYEGRVEVRSGGDQTSVAAGQQLSAPRRSTLVSRPQPDDVEWFRLDGIIGPRLDIDQGTELRASADARTILVSGVSEPGAQVTINGTPVRLDRDNRFSALVPIDGEGLIVAAATDARGGRTVRAITVLHGE